MHQSTVALPIGKSHRPSVRTGIHLAIHHPHQPAQHRRCRRLLPDAASAAVHKHFVPHGLHRRMESSILLHVPTLATNWGKPNDYSFFLFRCSVWTPTTSGANPRTPKVFTCVCELPTENCTCPTPAVAPTFFTARSSSADSARSGTTVRRGVDTHKMIAKREIAN